MTTSEKASSKPVQVFKLRGTSASVFRNPTDTGGSFYKVQIVRTFKDGEEFKTTPTFSRDDLPLVWTVSQKAWEFVMEQEAKDRATNKDDK